MITYAAVQSLATALERTGSDEPLALVKDLKANGANTVIGPLNWDEKGDLKGFDFGVFQWHADGSSTAARVIIPPPVKCGRVWKGYLMSEQFLYFLRRELLTASRWAVPTR